MESDLSGSRYRGNLTYSSLGWTGAREKKGVLHKCLSGTMPQFSTFKMFFSLQPKKRTKRKAPATLVLLWRTSIARRFLAAGSKTRPAFKRTYWQASDICRLKSAKTCRTRLRCNGGTPHHLLQNCINISQLVVIGRRESTKQSHCND
jgi:hypothetical protein